MGNLHGNFAKKQFLDRAIQISDRAGPRARIQTDMIVMADDDDGIFARIPVDRIKINSISRDRPKKRDHAFLHATIAHPRPSDRPFFLMHEPGQILKIARPRPI